MDASENHATQSETARSDARLPAGRAAALIRNATLEQELGRPSEAERLLNEAIAMIERNEGAAQASLGVALNELGRLYIRQSDFSRAEVVLERLLHVTRAKGDRHPDVATALAGLAVAKRGLGDEATAEALLRRALRIREEVLAPDHMAIVITLEQLAATCAARDNLAEALVHLQRALLRRERTLGTEHASVKAVQARIADLERRNRESMAKADEPPVATRAARLTPVQRLAAVISQVPAIVTAPAIDSASRHIPGLVSSLRRTGVYAAAGAVLIALSIAAFDVNAFGRPEREPAPAPAAESHDAVGTLASAQPSQVLGGSAPERSASGREAAPTHTAANAASTDVPVAPIAVTSLRKLVVPRVAIPSVDSLVRSVAVARDAGAEPIAADGGPLSAPHVDDATIMPPVLIGAAPTPRFPDELRGRRLEGEVVVRFRVTENGRVDASSLQVVQSEHELFTAAVRDALRRFRFEPAHAAGPGAKPQAAWVQSRFQFSARS